MGVLGPVDGGGRTLRTDWTIREVLNWTRGYFEDAGIVQPRLEAEMLLAHALDVDRLQLYLAPDKPLTEVERSRYRTVVKKRRDGAPLRHLIGEVSFFGLKFRVDRDALIPRHETEDLLDHVLKRAPRDEEITCLDLGTGTGVLAVCMARYLPRAQVTALDISPQALHVAKENARINGVLDRVCFVESDWFEQLAGTYDLITANPPYIPHAALTDLPVEVRDHEPRVALDGGSDGLQGIRSIVLRVCEYLRPGGHLLLEVGHDQGERVARMMEEANLLNVSVELDMARKPRFVIGCAP